MRIGIIGGNDSQRVADSAEIPAWVGRIARPLMLLALLLGFRFAPPQAIKFRCFAAGHTLLRSWPHLASQLVAPCSAVGHTLVRSWSHLAPQLVARCCEPFC